MGNRLADDDNNIPKESQHLLARIRRANRGDRRRGDDPVIDGLGTGANTRERMCDGKVKIRTPGYAQELAKLKGEEHGCRFETYFCPFCRCYHMTTKGP